MSLLSRVGSLGRAVCEEACNVVRIVCTKGKALAAVAIVGVVTAAGTAPALAEVTLPSTGVNVGEHITAAITALGAVALVAIGGFFAFLVIRLGLRWARKAAAIALAGGLYVLSQSDAQAAVTLPTTGVDVGEHITAAITALGAVALVAIGGFFAFLVIRLGLRWARKAA